MSSKLFEFQHRADIIVDGYNIIFIEKNFTKADSAEYYKFSSEFGASLVELAKTYLDNDDYKSEHTAIYEHAEALIHNCRIKWLSALQP